MKDRIMYIELKEDGVTGSARIGRMTFSQTGRSIYYRGRCFGILKNGGFKTNYYDSETGERYWISGCKKKGGDRLYPGTIEIDEDVREEYWTKIRQMPEKRRFATIRCPGKYGGRGPN
jgi:hypothetical protein